MNIISLENLKQLQNEDILMPKIIKYQYSAILDQKTCLLPETKIFTSEGEKNIKDINIGDNVLCSEGFQLVIAKSKSSRKKYLKISLSNGRVLKLTPEHKVFVNGHFIKAENLKIDDIINSIHYCGFCNIPFIKKENRKFCSRKCYLKYHSRFIKETECKICGKKVKRSKMHKDQKNNFCSRECYLEFRKDNYEYNLSLQGSRIKKHLVCCKNCLQEFITINHIFCSQECYWEWMRLSGKNSDYKKWRKLVFERDNFICQNCGIKEAFLNAHHIKSKTYYPEYKFDIDNGVTLCIDCHALAHDKRQKNLILSQGRFFDREDNIATY